MRILLALLVFTHVAAAAPLASTITQVQLDPPVVVVPASAGKTVLERYRSAAKPTSDTPLVVVVRLADANSPDTFAVKTAQRDGTKIKVAIEARKYQGPLRANVVTVPLVEIQLGTLPKGTYQIDIDEQILDFTTYDAPQTAAKPHRGLSSSIALTVQ